MNQTIQIFILLSIIAVVIDHLWIKQSTLGAIIIAITGGFVGILTGAIFSDLEIITLSIPALTLSLCGALALLVIRKVLFSLKIF